MIFELLYIHTPFQAEFNSKIFQNIMNVERHLKFDRNPERPFMDIIIALLCSNPSYRLGNLSAGVKGIMDHPFFESIDWHALFYKSEPAPYVPVIKDSADASNFGAYEEEKSIPKYYGNQGLFANF
jgi:protein kinase A